MKRKGNSRGNIKIRGEGGALCHWNRYPLQSLHWSIWIFPKGTVAHEEPMQEQIFPEGLQPMGRVHTTAGEQCEREGMAKNPVFTGNPMPRYLPACYSEVSVEMSRVME